MTISRATLVIIVALAVAMASQTASASVPASPALGAVVFTGSTAYPAANLFSVYGDHLGDAITRDSARAIATALADLYASDGYVRPEVSVDDTLAADGILRISVFEAHVTRVHFEGSRGRHAATLERISTRLTSIRSLRQDDVPAALREMRALSGLTATATAQRDDSARNAFQLMVKTNFSPIDGTLRTNNRGTEEIGPMFVQGQVFANGLVGRQERIGLVFSAATNTDEYLGAGLYVEFPFGTHGTRASALLFHSRSAPNEAPVDLADRYTRNRATLRFQRPVLRNSNHSLSFSGGIELDDLSILREADEVRDDRLRIFEAALQIGVRTSAGTQYSSRLQLRKGLDGLGSGLEASDLSSDPRRVDFTMVQWQATVARRFAERWSARLDTFAQFTGHVLPDSERFKIGGERLGRGFEVAEIAGDRGLGAKAELRCDLFNTGGFIGRISSYGFYDTGTAWKQDMPGRESADTAGLGLAMSGASLTGYIELAAPLSGADIEGKRKPSVFAELAWRF